jgi:hypothetical protein
MGSLNGDRETWYALKRSLRKGFALSEQNSLRKDFAANDADANRNGSGTTTSFDAPLVLIEYEEGGEIDTR